MHLIWCRIVDVKWWGGLILRAMALDLLVPCEVSLQRMLE